MTDRKPIDWEAIEKGYRAGLLSVRELAAAHGITHGAINKRSKRDGWERDLHARIQAKAEALVSKRQVSETVSAEQVATERVLIEANAEVIANIRMAHRGDITRARTIVLQLLQEIEDQTGNVGGLERMADILRQEDDKGVDKLNDLFRKVISTPSRIDSMKKLSETLKNLVGMEREAYGLATAPEGGAGPGKRLMEVDDDELAAIAAAGSR